MRFRPIFLPLSYLLYFFTPHSRLKFTREGVWFFFMTLAVGAAALNTGIGLLYLVLAMMLSFIIVSGILSELALMMLSVKRVVPREIYGGEVFPVTFLLHNCKRFFPSFSLNIVDAGDAWVGGIKPEGYLLKMPAGQMAAVSCRGMILRRGLHSLEKVVLRTEYPFGLFVKETDYRCEQELLVYPPLGEILDRSLLEASEGRSFLYRRDVAAQERDEFHALREYRTGDNPRWIHWRSSARRDSLMIKEFEARMGREVIIYLDNAAPLTPPERGREREQAVELAVSFTATLINELHGRGYPITLVSASPEPLLQFSYPGGDGLTPLLRTLALVGSSGRGLGEMMRERRKSWPEPGLRVVVTAGGDEQNSFPDSGDGLKVIRVSHPSFRYLFSPPAMEGFGQ